MFVDIFKTFWKLIFLTVLLLIAFALSFYMALDDHSPEFDVREKLTFHCKTY